MAGDLGNDTMTVTGTVAVPVSVNASTFEGGEGNDRINLVTLV